ncbi:hypothetical protein JX265_006270 [Neoarthrinium moseri]|uniref:DUF1750-domain-containing protein n=1 Tax=Neoarthrinium moseri TaxID=1658444 RepID=A0A9P9WM67_9PEZI|nr:hypothetical protein JX266_012111 [Neoarthrinium moseri]KAI1870100.1 hypothetical protein JX265_006270 [Neoarthrinium moseri]
MSAMGDPSHGVNRDLLPHVHLVSTYRYTHKPRVEIPEVTQMLMNAPSIARDKAPFFWTYLDRPENGNTMLTWQPLQLLGTQFASDGYIWPPAEQYFTQDMGNGIILEMYYHKAGYSVGEPVATHSRRRFRLCPSNAPHNPNAPQVDPSLWLVHYGPIDNNERIPVQMIPRDPRAQHIMDTRAHLQRCGQIQRKEFILSDRVNWPQIAWPRELSRQPVYANNRPVPQNMAYPTHPQTGAPPPKRARTTQAAHQVPHAIAGLGAEGAYDDDEDYSRGDLFDHLTPREISLHRYQQNHEWMEEILSSPYRMGQIGFASLGLGLKGELAKVTDGIFEAQGIDAINAPSKGGESHLDEEQAAEFKKRVNQRIDSTNDEIAKMKAEHEKKMAQFKKNSLLSTAEKDLRTAVDDVTPGLLSLEKPSEESEDGAARWTAKHGKKVDDIVSLVQAQLGRQAEAIQDLRRIQDGGYQEPAPEPTPQPSAPLNPGAGASQGGSIMGDHEDIDMGGTAAGLLDQMHTGMSSTSTPGNNFPTPQAQSSAVPSTSGTPANLNGPSPHPPPPAPQAAPPKQEEDVDMTGTEAEPSGTAPDQGTGSGDWVVVPKDGVTPDPSSTSANPTTSADQAAAAAAATPKPPSQPASKQPSATGTPAAGSIGFDANDFDSLDNLDSAGDALASFSDTPADLGGDFMEDSAFGDAFHGVDAGDDDAGNTPAGDAGL